MADGMDGDELSTVGEWLETQSLNKHFPLFVGYTDIGALLKFTEADFVRLGVTNANDRRTMLRSLAEEASTLRGGLCAPEENSGRSLSPNASGRLSPVMTARKGSSASQTMKKLFKGKSPVKAMTLANHSSPGSTPAASGGHASSSGSATQVSLEHQPWYHGLITRKQAESAVKKDGDILVRESISKKGSYVLTARWRGQALHFVINRLETALGGGTTITPALSSKSKGKRGLGTPTSKQQSLSSTAISDLPELAPPVIMYRFERDSFPTIVELINHYLSSKQAISELSGAIAKYPVPRVATSDGYQSKTSGSGRVTPNSTYGQRSGAGGGKDTQSIASMGSTDGILVTSRQHSGTELSVGSGSGVDSAICAASAESRGSSFLGNGIGSPPASNYEMVNPIRYQMDSDSVSRMSNTSSSSSLQQAAMLANQRAAAMDLPDPELLKAMCSMVISYPVAEVATHLTRVNMRLAHFVLPDENLQMIDRFLPILLPEALIADLRQAQESWRKGKVGGLATIHLEQGGVLAKLLLLRFNSLSHWVAAAVTGAGDLAKRRNMLCRMIEVAQYLQSDMLADLFGFMAIMRGLQMQCVTRLRTTWANLRRHASSVAVIYESQLCQLADNLRSGIPTHQHLIPSLPYLEPILLLATQDMQVLDLDNSYIPVSVWEVGLDIFGLDAVRAHMHAARALCVQCDAYRLAGTARLRGTKAVPDLEAYFKRDFPCQLYMSRPGVQMLEDDMAIADVRAMLQAMSEAAESDSSL